MEVLEAIFTRRSIRKFTGQPIGDDDLYKIMRAGCYAPSARNHQPWHFVVVRECTILQAIALDHPYAKMMPQAGCCIVTCGDKQRQGMTGFLIEDCSAAIQNMLLAAHGLGLGAVWCGLYPLSPRMKTIRELLNLPANILPVGMIALGHKDEERSTGERYDPSKIHFEAW